MSLVDLKTDLKSLKYGQDRPGGGDSGQPYIVTDINTASLRIPFDDGSMRYGIVGALKASETDRLRINKFLYSGIQGPLFIIKQVGLQLSNPRLEVPKNPRNIIQGIPENVLAFGTNGLLEPTRIYNGGVNTLAQIPVTAFGRHFNRHGLLVEQSDASKYEAVVAANNESTIFNPKGYNRLISYKDKFKLGDGLSNAADPTQQLINRVNRIIAGVTNVFNTISAPLGGPRIPKFSLTPEQQIIDQYFGGPDSVYGLGQTIIRRSSNTEDGDKIQQAYDRSKQFAGKTINDKNEPEEVNYVNTKNFGITNQLVNAKYYADVDEATNRFATLDTTTYSNLIVGGTTYQQVPSSSKVSSNEFGAIKITNKANASYSAYKKIIDSKVLVHNPKYINNSSSLANEFGIYGDNFMSEGAFDGINPEILPTSTSSPLYTNGSSIVKISLPWNKVTREIRVGSGRQDSINLTPLFSADKYWDNTEVTITSGPDAGTYNIRDLVKFKIQAVLTEIPDTSSHMYFRAYLTSLSDSVDASWNDVRYAGRGNPFYIYSGFSRKVSIGFKVAALSAEEMKPMYTKLNYLMSSLMPDYSNNLMRGPLHRLTVGNYLDAQLGILNSISYTVPNDSPWEIAIDEPEGGSKQLILPHIIEVSMTFTPIGVETGASNGTATGSASNLIEHRGRNVSLIAQNTTGNDRGTIQYYDAFNEK